MGGGETRTPRVDVVRHDASGLVAAVAVDREVSGRSAGGIRIHARPDDDSAANEARSLARAMTRKALLAGVRCGGAKIVVRADRLLDRREALRALGRHVEGRGGALRVGPDLGFTAADRDAVGAETRFIDPPDVAAGMAEATAVGVREAMAAALALRSLDGVRVAIQGLGKVGGALARLLLNEGGIVYGHDVVPALVEAAGVRRIDDERRLFEGTEDFDVVAPCAVGQVVDLARARTLRCRVLVGAANDVLAAPEDEVAAALARRGIVHVPDYLANAGALIQWAALVLDGRSRAEAAAAARRIGDTTRAVLARAREERATPWAIAARIVEERLAGETSAEG